MTGSRLLSLMFAQKIFDDFQAALEQFREIAADLDGKERSKCGLPCQTCAPRGS